MLTDRAFGPESAQLAAEALRGYGGMFVPLILRDLFNRFQYGYKDTRRPMLSSAVSIAADIALSMTLCPRLGIFGVTLATNISVLLCEVLNLCFDRRHNAHLRFGPLLRLIPPTVLGSALCILAAFWASRSFATLSPLLRFTLAALCGGGDYLTITALLLPRLLKQDLGGP